MSGICFFVPRNSMQVVIAGIVLGFFAVLPQAGNANSIDLAGLLEDMLDRSKIAEFPETEFLCKQVSSYNRASTEPGKAGWYVNDDSSFFYGYE